MKKLITIVAAAAVALSVNAANYVEQSLLNGYNVYAPTNSTLAIGQTNIEYTYLHGEIVYSLTNYFANTNSFYPDAFDPTATFIHSDANGDVNPTVSIHWLLNATNFIPVAITNSQGQYFITNTWPLAGPQYPTYMFPATTNTYPLLPNANSTNLITFFFQRGWTINQSTPSVTVWDTSTNVFQFQINGATYGTAGAPLAGITNVPTSFLQGVNMIRLSTVVVGATSTVVTNGPYLINQVSVGQFVP
jgi:hypothetical protein